MRELCPEYAKKLITKNKQKSANKWAKGLSRHFSKQGK